MTAVALRGLCGRKLRATLTALAIILGVAMISGTYILTDTIDKAFNNIFTRVYADTDAVDHRQDGLRDETTSWCRLRSGGSACEGAGASRRQSAAGSIGDSAQLTDQDGESIGGGGPPTLAFGIEPADDPFNPLELTSAPGPTAPARS